MLFEEETEAQAHSHAAGRDGGQRRVWYWPSKNQRLSSMQQQFF